MDVPYVWPTGLRQPERPPRLIYLDLNQWIRLARTQANKEREAAAPEVLEALIKARDSGKAIFPLSGPTFIEIEKIRRYRQRRDLRVVMELLSGFNVVASRLVIARLEIEAMLDQAVGKNPNALGPVPYLDWGVLRAFGKVGGIRIRSADGTDMTDIVRRGWPKGRSRFDERLRDIEIQLQRSVLDGPRPDEEHELRELGWDPSSTRLTSERRARQEQAQASQFRADPKWRRGRIRDLIAAREVCVELSEMLYRGLHERTSKIDDAFDSVEGARECLDAMPSFDVAVTIKVEYHRNPNHRWTANDIHDIDALGSVVPYCDVVVTDKAAAATVQRTGLAERLGTTVLSSLESLVAVIS